MLVLDKDFWTKNIVTTLDHTPYSPDVAPADSSFKGRRFCDATDIKNATEELKSLYQNDSQECFQLLYINAGRIV